MPIYEYACTACGHQFEEWQKMSDAPVRSCPKCKKKKVEKLISRTAFQLKGSGWYSDLYSSSKPGQDAKDGKGDGESKSDSKDTGTSAKESAGGSDSSAKGAEKPSSSEASPKKKKEPAKKAEPRAV